MVVFVSVTGVAALGSVVMGAAFGWLDEPTIAPPIPQDPGALKTPTQLVRSNGKQYLDVSFTLLGGYGCSVPEAPDLSPDAVAAALNAKIPDAVKALDGQRVAVAGFMLPVLGQNDKVSGFILLANQMGCCFGITPPLNWWIDVELAGGKLTKVVRDVPLTVYGVLHVGATAEDAAIGSLYRIDADRVRTPGFWGS